MEDDIDMKQQFEVENLQDATNDFDAVIKNHVDQKVYDYVQISKLENSLKVRCNKKNKLKGNANTGCESFYVGRDLIFDSKLATKKYVDNHTKICYNDK